MGYGRAGLEGSKGQGSSGVRKGRTLRAATGN